MLTNYLIVGAILFALGALGFLTRRNMIVMFLSGEMMLLGVALNFVAFGSSTGGWANWHGTAFVIFILTVAAADAGLALALVLVLYRRSGTLDISVWQELREPDQPAITDEPDELAAAASPALAPAWPKLPAAGVEPEHSEEDLEEMTHAR